MSLWIWRGGEIKLHVMQVNYADMQIPTASTLSEGTTSRMMFVRGGCVEGRRKVRQTNLKLLSMLQEMCARFVYEFSVARFTTPTSEARITTPTGGARTTTLSGEGIFTRPTRGAKFTTPHQLVEPGPPRQLFCWVLFVQQGKKKIHQAAVSIVKFFFLQCTARFGCYQR